MLSLFSQTDKTYLPNLHIRIAAAALLLAGSALLTSCSGMAGDTPAPTPTTAAATPTRVPPSPTAIPSPTVITLSPPYPVWVDPSLPSTFQELIAQSELISFSSSEESSQLTLSSQGTLEAGSLTYLAVAPFYSLFEDISSLDLLSCWSEGWNQSLPFQHIFIADQSWESLAYLWGPAADGCFLTIPEEDLIQTVWRDADALAIIPFEELDPSYKVLSINNLDPLDKETDLTDYPLLLRLFYQVPPGVQFSQTDNLAVTNYDRDSLSLVALTGVTALVRDTANIMEAQGILYPAGDIEDILTSADITHISNEVPFAVDCPTPDASQVSLQFCSDDSYLQLLEAVGTDIVELSGDHFGDWGPEAMLHTIDLYTQKGWAVYGGGRTLEEGLAPVMLTNNGNQFAFIGCNGKGIDKYATATATNPGASQCDFNWMISEINRLANEGYLVIATMQHEEVDSFWSISLQQYDFRRLAEAGAVIVSGSQAHHPQAIEFYGDSFIHYGLGNLFFDQWFLAQYNPKLHVNKDKAFIDLHYFYQGQHISTRLVPLQFIDNARPRPMTAEEQIPFLEEFYQSSRWNGDWIYLYSSGIISNRTDH